MRRIRLGVVGCGRISEKHFQAIEAVGAAELVAVCDIDATRAAAAAARTGVPSYLSMDAMLAAHPDIDVVDVLTPSGDHADRAVAALAAGKHVIVEKPMALKTDDAERMCRAADAANRRLFVVQQNRYNPPVVRLREVFDAGELGRIVMGTVRVRWCRDQAYYDQDAWRGTRRWDGGVLDNQANHHVDLLHWFLGVPVRVYAVARAALVDIETADTAAAVIQFESGALGIVEATTAARPLDLEGSLSLLGERGTVVIGGFAVNQVTTWQFTGRDDGDEIARALSTTPLDVYGHGHRQVIADVCAAVGDGRATLLDGHDGIRTVRLLDALNRSIETGLPVDL